MGSVHQLANSHEDGIQTLPFVAAVAGKGQGRCSRERHAHAAWGRRTRARRMPKAIIMVPLARLSHCIMRPRLAMWAM